MSSQVIDEKVVEMRFQNSQFEKGVKESMSTIDKLKASLNFSGASKSFNQITEAANKVSFKGLERNVDELHNYINLKAVAMFTVVSNMVSQIQSSVTNMVKQFTIVPISTGFQEYELKMGSVQTIMAATGESLETVNKYLQELNEYSDKTIYSFSDMTQNIGKFTNAGVKLEDAVLAMKGISNEAAISGANANEASRAMYNLAQSLSMGYVQYIDWKSIENANMATVQFKQNLTDVAVQLGLVKKSSDGYYEVAGKSYNLQQLFKDALKDEWLTTEVLIKTLRDYADETTEIGKKAYAAAQDVKTFTMMMDTLKEAAQSGWAYTWEIFIGDFNEAKKMFTEFSQMFGKMIDDSSEARNSLLRGVLGSKWDRLISYINAAGIATEEFEGRLTRVLREAGFPVDEMVKKWGSLGEAIRHMGDVKDYVIKVIQSFTAPIVDTGEAVGAVTGKLEDFQKVVNQVIRGEFGSGKKRVDALTKAGWNYAQVQGLVNKVWERNGKNWKNTTITMEDLVEVLGKMSVKELEQVGITEEQVQAFQQLQEQAALTGTDLNKLIENLYKPTGRELIFDTIRNAVNALVQRFQLVKQAWLEVFPQKGTEELYGILEAINKFSKALILNEDKADKLRRTFRGIFSILGIVSDIIQTALRVLFPGLIKVYDVAEDGILSVTAVLGDMIYGFREFLKSGTLVADVVSYLKESFLAGVFGIKQWLKEMRQVPIVADVINTISNALQGVLDFLKYVFDNFYDQMSDGKTNMVEAFLNIADKIGKKLRSIADTLPSIQELREAFKLMFEDFEKSGDNVVVGFLLGLGNALLEVPKKITEFAALVVNTFKDYLGIASPSKLFFQLGKYVIMGFVDGIFHYMSETDRAFNEWRIQMLKYFLGKEIKREFEKIRDFFKGVFDDIVEFLRVFGTSFGEVLGNIRDVIRNEDIMKPILDIAKDLLELLIIFKLLRGWNNIGEGISDFGEGIKRLGKAFQKVARGVKAFFKSLSAKNYTKAISILLISISALLGVIFLISKTMSAEDINKVMTLAPMIYTVLGIIGGLMVAFIVVAGIVNKLSSIKGLNKALEGMALLMLSIGGSIVLIAYAMAQIAAIPEEGIKRALLITELIAGAIFSMATTLGIISIFSKGSLAGVAFSLLAMALSLKMIVGIIQNVFYDKKDGILVFNEAKSAEIMNAFSSIFWIIITLVGSLGILGAAVGAGTKFAGVGAAVWMLSISVINIVGAVWLLDAAVSTMKHPILSIIGIIALMAVLGVLASVIALFSRNTNKSNLNAAAALVLSLAAACLLICFAIKQLDGVQISDSAINLLVGLILVIAVFAMIIEMMDIWSTTQIKSTNTCLYGVAALIGVIGLVIGGLAYVAKNYDIDRMIDVAGSLAIVLAAVAAVIFVLSKITKKNAMATVSIFAIAAAIVALAGSIWLLKDIPTDHIISVASSIAICLGALMLCSDLVPVAWPAVAAIIAIAGAIGVLAYSIYEIGKLEWGDVIQGIVGVAAAAVILIGATVLVIKVLGDIAIAALPGIVALVLVAAAIWLIVEAIDTLAKGDNILSKFFKDPQQAILDLIDYVGKLLIGLQELVGFLSANSGILSKTGKIIGAKAVSNADTTTNKKNWSMPTNTGKIIGAKVVSDKGNKADAPAPQPAPQPAPPVPIEEFEEAGKQANEAYWNEALAPAPQPEADNFFGSFWDQAANFDGAGAAVEEMKTRAEAMFKNVKFDKDSLKNMIPLGDIEISDGDYKQYLDKIMTAIKTGDYSQMGTLFGSQWDPNSNESMAKMLELAGVNAGDLFAGSFLTENQKKFEEAKDKLSELSEGLFGSYVGSKISGLVTDTIVPVISPSLAPTAGSMGDLTSLLGNMTANGFNAVQFPETMNTTSPDVVNAVNALHQDIQTLYVKIANLQVRLDTGALVGNLTPQINQSMGKMAVYKVRGN